MRATRKLVVTSAIPRIPVTHGSSGWRPAPGPSGAGQPGRPAAAGPAGADDHVDVLGDQLIDQMRELGGVMPPVGVEGDNQIGAVLRSTTRRNPASVGGPRPTGGPATAVRGRPRSAAVLRGQGRRRRSRPSWSSRTSRSHAAGPQRIGRDRQVPDHGDDPLAGTVGGQQRGGRPRPIHPDLPDGSLQLPLLTHASARRLRFCTDFWIFASAESSPHPALRSI